LALGGQAGWLLRRIWDQPCWFGVDLAPVLPAEALLLQLLHKTAQLQPRLVQSRGVGGQAQAESLHRMAAGTATTGQGAPQAQAVAAPFQPQSNDGGGQKAVLALDLGIQGRPRGRLRGGLRRDR
jgi:hypothetical protein